MGASMEELEQSELYKFLVENMTLEEAMLVGFSGWQTDEEHCIALAAGEIRANFQNKLRHKLIASYHKAMSEK